MQKLEESTSIVFNDQYYEKLRSSQPMQDDDSQNSVIIHYTEPEPAKTPTAEADILAH